ncbi:MAG: hypothetical protein JWO09_2489 [Bacteroidetes bacterium]|nr:hypothetical protein [Bacteroidota bacterium]
MSESKTPFSKELLGLLLLFSFLVLWTIRSHAAPVVKSYKKADLKTGQKITAHHTRAVAL